jgi:hypothetical protein
MHLLYQSAYRHVLSHADAGSVIKPEMREDSRWFMHHTGEFAFEFWNTASQGGCQSISQVSG